MLGILLLDIPLPFLNDNRQASINHSPGTDDKQHGILIPPDKTDDFRADSLSPFGAGTTLQTEVGHAGSGAFSRHAPADGATAVLPPSSAPAGVARRAPLLVAGQGAWSRASLSDESLLDMLGLTRLPIPAIGGVRAVAAAALDLPAPATSQDAPSPFAPAEQTAPLTMPGAPPIPANIPRGQNSSGAPLAPRGNGQGMLPPLPSASDVPAVPQLTPNIAPQAMPEDPNAKAQELARQQQDILMLRQQMDERLKDIETAEQKMQDMIREAKGLEEKKVRHLIQVYANMKPKVAAKAIESLDERIAVRILSGMVPKQSGEILTYTNPEKTAKLTELLTRIRMPE